MSSLLRLDAVLFRQSGPPPALLRNDGREFRRRRPPRQQTEIGEPLPDFRIAQHVANVR